jgi:UDP-galactose-lipid carrier transferase
MVPQGHAGLSKRYESPDSVVVVNDRSAGAAASLQLSSSRLGGLHLVDVYRRSHRRPDALAIVPGATGGRWAYPLFKRVLDLVGASIAILILSPLVLTIVACILASGGSPFFRHRRVGQRGVLFDCFKFRTMVMNSDEVLEDLLESDAAAKEEWLRDHKLKEDPRITFVGRFLRRSSLDELPQLWNVLRGDMSLVGPRPVVPAELRRYGRRVSMFLSARPGITGLWQISGRNNTDYRRRVALDVCYVRSRSAMLDVYILMKTLRVVFTTSGAY